MEVFYLPFEQIIAVTFDWPIWITRTIIILCTILSIIGISQISQIFSYLSMILTEGLFSNTSKHEQNSWKFRRFQLSYLTVYLLIMLADWLQGTNMYTLYTVSFIIFSLWVK